MRIHLTRIILPVFALVAFGSLPAFADTTQSHTQPEAALVHETVPAEAGAAVTERGPSSKQDYDEDSQKETPSSDPQMIRGHHEKF